MHLRYLVSRSRPALQFAISLPTSHHRSFKTAPADYTTAPPPPRHGNYQATLKYFDLELGTKVAVAGSSVESIDSYVEKTKAFGTNVVGSTVWGGVDMKGKGKDETKSGSIRQMTEQLIPFAITIQEDQPSRSEDYIMQCLEHEVPLIISCSTLGSKESNRIASAVKTQDKSRLIGPGSKAGLIMPFSKVWLGNGSLRNVREGRIGLISSESSPQFLIDSTQSLSEGQSAIFSLGNSSVIGTKQWEAMEWLLSDDATKVICMEASSNPSENQQLTYTLEHYISSRPSNMSTKPMIVVLPPSGRENIPDEQWEKMGVKVVARGEELEEALKGVVGKMEEDKGPGMDV